MTAASCASRGPVRAPDVAPIDADGRRAQEALALSGGIVSGPAQHDVGGGLDLVDALVQVGQSASWFAQPSK